MTNIIKIAVTNLGQYNEGRLNYDWLTLPATTDEIDEVMKNIGIDGVNYEEHFISDYEAPFSIGEYDNLYDLNEKAEEYCNLNGDEQTVLDAIIEEYTSDFDEALQIVLDGEFTIHYGSDCMEMVAYDMVNEQGLFGNVDEMGTLGRYIDYEALGRDLSFEGTYFPDDMGNYIEIFN